MYSKKKPRPNSRKTVKKSGAAAPASGSSHEPGAKGVKISRRQLFLIIGIVVVVILGILAIPWYQNYIAPFNRTIINVDGTEVSARYFLDRSRLAESDPMTMLDALTNEMVIKIMAPQYGIQVTEDDIDQTLRSIASGGSGDLSDIEFEEWYRQQLNDYQISNEMYREIVYLNLLTAQLNSYLVEHMSTVADQVHLHIIAVTDYEAAQDAFARIEAGEDFADVAEEVSIDASAADGGDLGWIPPVIIPDYGYLIASLEVNEPTSPLAYYSDSTTSSTPSAYYIFMVSEKESGRELDEDHLAILQSMALDLWLDEEIPKHEITYNFNSEIYAWLNWQLEKSSGD